MKEELKFMAAKWFVAIWVINSSCFILNALLKFLTGNSIVASLDILVGCLSGYVAVRVAKIPAFCFYSDHVAIFNRPIMPPKTIFYSDIISIEKKGRNGLKLKTTNKQMNLPLSWLSKSDREVVVSEFQNITNSIGRKDEAVPAEKVQPNAAWF